MPFSDSYLEPIGTTAVLCRMLANLQGIFRGRQNFERLQGVLEQLLLLRPESPEEFIMLLRVLEVQHNYHDILVALERAESELRRGVGVGTRFPPMLINEFCAQFRPLLAQQEAPGSVKSRADPQFARVEFKIGQVILHRKHGYRGVIYGFDPVCAMSEEWIETMSVRSLPLGEDQPFYNVLVDTRDRSQQATYVAQEHINVLQRGTTVHHPDIGKYFCAFDASAGRYVPADDLATQYPDS
eukprot:TRINITY_DN9464_c0_g1_i1.p1 TRINITY_DN9464_c0_g1~~TRINITY_DN9464_c0_g1_i1.p1  ORF type:complete len:241 (+),score=92.85 TRINITY_DN9464_c0_g1_i1:562-1284(+)